MHTTHRRRFLIQGAGLVGSLALLPRARAEAPTADEMTAKAVAFLKSRQAEDGSWSPQRGPGITGHRRDGPAPVEASDRERPGHHQGPVVPRGLHQAQRRGRGAAVELRDVDRPDGLLTRPTSRAGTTPRSRRARRSSRGSSGTSREGKGPDDPFYGGAGYGGSKRPDLSNTSFFLEALRDTGLPADDPALKKAQVFISRCQNRKSEFNDQPWADKVNDGGFIYTRGQRRDEHGRRTRSSPTAACAPMRA